MNPIPRHIRYKNPRRRYLIAFLKLVALALAAYAFAVFLLWAGHSPGYQGWGR